MTLAVLLLTVALSHWITPTDNLYLHAVHVTMRKAFLIPVILAAIWFGLRGALCTAATVTTLYLPHVAYQWRGVWAENLSQFAEVGGIWLVAVTAGLWLCALGTPDERRSSRTPEG